MGFVVMVLVVLVWSIREGLKANRAGVEPASEPAPDDVVATPSSEIEPSAERERSIEPVGTPVPAPHREQRIFVSYRRDDSADVAGRIYDRLTQAFEKSQVFKDVDSIPLGLDFRKHLQQMVTSCDVVLVVMGDRWLTASTANSKRRLDDPKDFVRIELETALQREIPVIPVLVRGASVPEETELPPTLSALAYRNGIAIRPDPDFHRDMDRLIQSLRSHLAGISTAGE